MARRQREDEKSARAKRRCLYFAAAGGVGQKEESICEKCALGKYFYKVQKLCGAAHGKCASKGEEKAMWMKQEKRKFRWRGDKERENK